VLLYAPPTTRLREFFMRRVWRHSPLKLVGYWPLPLTSLYFPCFLTYEYTRGTLLWRGLYKYGVSSPKPAEYGTCLRLLRLRQTSKIAPMTSPRVNLLSHTWHFHPPP